VGPSVSHIVQDLLLIKAESLSDRDQTLRSESTLSIDVHGHSFSATLCNGQLACNTQCVADLSLTCSEFSEYLSDAARLDTTSEELVQTLRSGGKVDHTLSFLKECRSCLEAQVHDFLASFYDFVYFGF